MERLVEPELMLDEDQAQQYANADFQQPHDRFVEELAKLVPLAGEASLVADLGCGCADVTTRLALRFPRWRVHGYDGSEPMLRWGQRRVSETGLQSRIQLSLRRLERDTMLGQYDGLVSNSLLHHLHDPSVLWSVVRRNTAPGGWIFVMDLTRPDTEQAASQLVEQYASTERPVLKRDFYNSLCAAFTVTEVRGQLLRAGLGQLEVTPISDRHWVACGSM